MQKTPGDIVGVVVHGHAGRYDPEKQRDAIATASPRAVFNLNSKDGLDLERLWKRSTDGRVFVVQWLFLICTGKASAKRKRDRILQFVDEVRERGGEILELGSGMRTKIAVERRKMLSDAFEAVASGRMPSMTAQRGRRRRVWSDAHKKVMWAEWFSHNNATNEDAAEAVSEQLGFEVDQFQIWHVIKAMRQAKGEANATGASGRPWQVKSK
jgi:hypothetical protein